jgi:hypothetical protein
MELYDEEEHKPKKLNLKGRSKKNKKLLPEGGGLLRLFMVTSCLDEGMENESFCFVKTW